MKYNAQDIDLNAETKQQTRNIFLEKVQETCLRHNGYCEAGNGVIVVDTKRFEVKERKAK